MYALFGFETEQPPEEVGERIAFLQWLLLFGDFCKKRVYLHLVNG